VTEGGGLCTTIVADHNHGGTECFPGFCFPTPLLARHAAWRSRSGESTWDRVILGPLQNQQLLLVRLRILFRKTAERQWPVLIWAQVGDVLVTRMHDCDTGLNFYLCGFM